MKKATALILSLLVAASLSACTGNTNEQSSGSADTNQSAGLLPPVIMNVDELEGTEVEIDSRRPLVVNSEDPTAWTGTVVDSSVAEFIEGSATATAAYNFGFEAVGAGKTAAAVTNGTQTINFTILVK